MPAAARKFIRHYKKLFTELSERQQGTNALSLALEGKKAPVRSINSQKMHVTEGSDEDSASATDTDARYALDVDMDSKVRYNDIKNKEGTGIKNASSKNSEVLGGRSISTSHRGTDGVWKQGYDPEEVYQRLADCQNGKGRQGETRTGHSGWLRDSQGNKLSILRLRKGFLRDLQRRQLSGKDTAGRELSPLIQKKVSNSVFKDENGNLLSMYHWTSAKFRDFAKGDTGFHFGTLQAAYIRYTQKSKKNWISNSFYKECYVNMKNPVFIDFDTISWDVFPTAHKLKQENVISDEEPALLEKKEGYYHTKYDSLAAVVLRNMLAEKGYDGIIYTNYNEGDISVMVLNPDQIYTVAENGIDVDHKDFRYALPENPSKPTEVDPDGPITWSVLKASLEQTAKDQGKQKELYLASVVYRGLPGTTGSPNLSAGEIKKMKANYTHERVYSKKNAFDLIDALSGAGSLSQKSKSAFADKAWHTSKKCIQRMRS